jgi:hypothetical protein
VKGHVYKLDYHVVNMCREQLAGSEMGTDNGEG